MQNTYIARSSKQMLITRFSGALLALSLLAPNAFSQAKSEVAPAEENHRVLLVGGAGLIQESDQPRIHELYQRVGLQVTNGLRDSLIAKGLAVESFVPVQRLSKRDFDTSVVQAIVKCKCTMVLQTTLRAQDGSLRFRFQAMTLKVSLTGITPLEKWQMTKDFSATIDSLSSAAPSEIVGEMTELLLQNRVFSKATDAPSSPQPKVITRSLWDGRQSYEASCAVCHTAGIAGSPRIGDKKAWAPRIASGYTALLRSTIHGKGLMAVQSGPHIDPIELQRAVVYLANQSGGRFAEPVVPASHPRTHTYTETPPPAPFAVAAPYEYMTPDQRLQYGEHVYKRNCLGCHLENGGGVGPIPPLKYARSFSDNNAVIRVVLQGSGMGSMPAWGSMSDIEISAVVNFMRAKFGNASYQDVQPQDVKRLR